MRIPFLLVCLLAALPAHVHAQGYGVFIHGPRGCAFLDGLGGDGAVFHALDADHMALDYWVLEGNPLSCQFDSEISLQPVPGKVETTSATCSLPDRPEFRTKFTLTYVSKETATLASDMWDEPRLFHACKR